MKQAGLRIHRRVRARPIPPNVLLALLILVFIGIGFWITYTFVTAEPKVTDFDSCVAAGNPVLETYPEQCTSDGKSYFRPGQAPPKPY